MTEANRTNHHPDIHVENCVVVVTLVTHAAGNTVTEKEFDGAAVADRLARTTPAMELRSLSQTFSLPDVSDVSFPRSSGRSHRSPSARPRPPRKRKRKPVTFKGVKLSRAPMQFEMDVLSCAEIPPRPRCRRAGLAAA